MKFDSKTFRITEGRPKAFLPLVIGLVGLGLSGIGWAVDARQFYHSYLVAVIYWLTIALGMMFFTMLHHLVNARWSIVLRRTTESIMTVMPLLAILAIPLLFGLHTLFQWSRPEVVMHDAVIQGKSSYLNIPFFLIRLVFYFVVWIGLAVLLYRVSMKQDAGSGGEALKFKMRKISAPGMVLFAMTITFFAYDWLMSLAPHWYSTIFGPYVYAGSFLSSLGFLVVVMAYDHHRKLLQGVVTVEHYHDVGKLMFAFVIFWAYMAFSQYFLMWYVNLPEETVWYLARWDGGWRNFSLLIVFGHFGLPFIALIFRASKRNPKVLSAISIWLLLMHWVDLYWVVFPNIYADGPHFSWIDLTTMVGVGSLFCGYFWRRFVSKPLVPVGDPGLAKSIEFSNA